MNTTIKPPDEDLIAQSQRLDVFVAGSLREDLMAVLWEQWPLPRLDSCVIEYGGSAVSATLDAASVLPAIGANLELRSDAMGGRVFCGRVIGHEMKLDDRGQRLMAHARGNLAIQLMRSVEGRWEVVDGQATELKSVPCVFNGGAGTWASQDLYGVGGRETRIFDNGPTCRRWSVGDALNYLLSIGLPAGTWANDRQELEALCGCIDLGEMKLTGLSMGEALAEAAGRAGLIVRACGDGAGLLIERAGGGRRRRLRIQVPPSLLSPLKTNVMHAHIEINSPLSRPPVLALGERKHHEVTVELLPGWDAALQSSRWRDYIASQSDNWPAMADVFRKWVLNEHGWYCDEPRGLEMFDLSAISEDFTSHCPRRFLPCLSSDLCGQSLGVVVEVRCGLDQPWRRWADSLWVSGRECSVYLGGEALPADFFNAALAGTAAVRVTATIAADAHLSVELDGDASLPRKVIDLSGRALWRKVHSSSAFQGAEGLGQAAEQDDTAMLEAAALSCRDNAGGSIEGQFALPWIDPTYRLGDVIERIEGQWMELPGPCGSASIRSIKHDYRKQITSFGVRA